MARLLVDNCSCCGKKLVPCVVIPAGVLPKFACCKGCDNSGTFLKLSTYKKN